MNFISIPDIDYWQFQGNPKLYDFNLAINDNVLDAWSVPAHYPRIKQRDKVIKQGDKVIIWLTGDNGGVGALAEINCIVPPGVFPLRDMYCRRKEGKRNREQEKLSWIAGLSFATDINMLLHPIYFKKTHIKGLEKLNVGRGFQNINYQANEQQYKIISNLIEDKFRVSSL